ncbi:hypothetical protein E0500_039295 [Streptomyces sp. KM273126]|uniref:hypothetical protein n=1 Tax=Streptomyces sp. KM273126 TaxID=2545247 RepID=UPI00103968E9|nr:hypothetical protein [Streptomyces sp. KM273126]MBA2813201.1 hypothetical protein [Streptomyces sp. KM273126]
MSRTGGLGAVGLSRRSRPREQADRRPANRHGGGTVDHLVYAVFNYPTLAESYKVAALDATNKLRQTDRIGDETPVRVCADRGHRPAGQTRGHTPAVPWSRSALLAPHRHPT